MPGAFCCGLGRKWRPLTPSSDDQQRGIESLFATHVVELIMSINEDCILIYKFYCWSSINSNLPVDRTPLCEFQSLRTNLVGFTVFWPEPVGTVCNAWLHIRGKKGKSWLRSPVTMPSPTCGTEEPLPQALPGLMHTCTSLVLSPKPYSCSPFWGCMSLLAVLPHLRMLVLTLMGSSV